MENEEKDTWTYLTHSGELNVLNSDIGSLSSSSIEFIQDDTVHYGCRKRRGARDDVEEVAADKDEVVGDLIEFIDITDNVPSTNEAIPLQQLPFNQPGTSATYSSKKASPLSQDGSEESSDSVTVLSVPNSDIENLPEDFWFDSDFELLNQQSFSDLAYLQLAARTGSVLNSSDQCDLKFRNSELGNAICQNGISDASDADDECSNNAGSLSAEEFEQNPPDSQLFSQTVSTVSVTPTPSLVHLSPSEMSSLFVNDHQRNVPKWSCGFLILLLLAFGALHAFPTWFPYGDSQFNISTDDSDQIKQMETVYQLNEQNKLLTKHVYSLEEELQNVLSSKHLLSEELHQMNFLLKNRITNLDLQIFELRQDISGVMSKAETTDPSPVTKEETTDPFPVTKEETTDPSPVTKEETTDPFPVTKEETTDPSPVTKEETTDPFPVTKEETTDPSPITKEETTDPSPVTKEETTDPSLVTKEETDAWPEDNEDKKTAEFPPPSFTNIDANNNNNKQDGIDESHRSKILVQKLERELKRVDLWKRLYFYKRCHSNDSSYSRNARDAKSLHELLMELSFNSLNFTGNGTLSLETVKQLMSSSMVELSQKAQNWKNYIAEKLQNFTDSQKQKNQQKSRGKSRPTFENLDVYANKMMNKFHATKEKLQNKFQKTLGKIGSKLDNFLSKNNLGNFFNLKTQEPIKRSIQLADEETPRQYGEKDDAKTTDEDEISVEIEKTNFKKKSSLQHDKPQDSMMNPRRNIPTVNLNKETSLNHQYHSNSQTFSLENISKQKKNKDKNHGQHKGKHIQETDQRHKDGNKKKSHLNKLKNSKKGHLHKQGKKEKRQLYNKQEYKEGRYSQKDPEIKQECKERKNNGKIQRLYKLNDNNKKTRFQMKESEDKEHFGKQNGKQKKQRPDSQRVKEKHRNYRFDRKQIKEKKSDTEKHKFQSSSRKSSQKEQQQKYSGKESSKRSHNLGEKQHLKCKKRLSHIAKKINKVSEENFNYMKHRKIRQLAFTLFHYNKDCLGETIPSLQVWSMCQQIWWSLCWQGLLTANPPNSQCYNHLLSWQLAVTVSPASYIGCERCGCPYWLVHFNDTASDKPEEKFSCKKINCNQNCDSIHQQRSVKERMPVSGMWYFKEDTWRHHNGMEPTLKDETNWYIKMMEARQLQQETNWYLKMMEARQQHQMH